LRGHHALLNDDALIGAWPYWPRHCAAGGGWRRPSCTGGLFAALAPAWPARATGSTRFRHLATLPGRALGVDAALIAAHGAVSSRSRGRCTGVLSHGPADLALA
jgi:hypothetical protein